MKHCALILSMLLLMLHSTMLAWAAECEAEIDFKIEVTQSVSESYSETVCQGSDYSGHGFNIEKPQNDTVCYREVDCDKYTLYLKVCKPVENNIFESICEGNTFEKYGFSETAGGVYTKNLQTSCGCDSTVILHLDVISNAVTTLFDKACVNEPYNGRGYKDIKVEEDMMLESTTIKSGCPAKIQLFITACFPAATQFKDTVERGKHYVEHGFDFYTYSDTVAVQNLKTVDGCDSIVTLSLVVYHDYRIEENATVCPGDSVLWQDKYYKTVGSHEVKYKSIYNMDSIRVLNLSNYPVYDIKEYHYLNQGSTYDWHGKAITDAGEYVDSMKTVHGCDSVFHLTVMLKYELVIPAFFSPDGDGVNDTWVIKNLDCYPNSTVEIFDRYGKRLAVYTDATNSWDGIYNGNALPSDDYWYVIRQSDTGQKISGHFTLRRGKQ